MKKDKKIKKSIPSVLYYIIIAGVVICFLAGAFLTLRFTLGAAGASAIDKNKDASYLEGQLLIINIPSGYVPKYNLGNISYKNRDYDRAVSYYYGALKHVMPKQRECSVRINLALSLLAQADKDYAAPENVDRTIKILLSAREILTEKGCAHADDEDGHNERAQKLKDEIDEYLKELGQDPESDESNEDNNQGDSEDNENDSDEPSSSYENRIKDKLREQKEEAQDERSSEQDYMRQYSDMFNDGDGEDDSPGNKTW